MLEKAFVLYNSLTNCWITIPTCNILLYITVITNTYKNKTIYPIIWKFNSQFENCNNCYI